MPEASIRHETKVRPNELFLLQNEKDLIKNHNMNEVPPKIQFDLNKNLEISKIIAEGIKAAEALEESISKTNKTYDSEQIEFKLSSNQQQIIYSTVAPPAPPQLIDELSPLSEYLRPPVIQNGPLFRPVKVAGRRPPPMVVERRRPPQNNQYRLVLPQPSIIVNHYKKPVSPLMRPFVKQQKPIKSIASFLVLGQPTELNQPSRKTFDQKYNNSTSKSTTKLPFKYIRENHPIKVHQHKVTDSLQSQSSHIGLRKKPMREPYLPVKAVKGTFNPPYEVYEHNLHSAPSVVAHAAGFQPDSVVVESGFKPIVRRRIDETEDSDEETANRRSDDNISEIDEAMEGDALFINQDIPTKTFEPMFIPSPPDNVNRKKLLQKERLTGDLLDMEIEDGDDKMAMAGERVDAYYLPPDTHKTPPHQSIYPEGSVVTYDGKAVLDTSLVNSLPLPLPTVNAHSQYSSGHLSKTEQLIRNTPQFGPFKGEIPPIGQDFVPPDVAPHLRQSPSGQIGTSARRNNTESANKNHQTPVTEYTNPLTNSTNPISTKLTLLNPLSSRSKRDDEVVMSVNEDDSKKA